MKHKSIHNDLIFYLDGELSSAREQEIKEHLAECEECRAFMEVLRTSFSMIENEKVTAVNPFFYQALKSKIENRANVETRFRLQTAFRLAFFTVLLIAGIGFGVTLGAKVTVNQSAKASADEMFYFDEMGSEPIESYFLN